MKIIYHKPGEVQEKIDNMDSFYYIAQVCA
jgi:hypothetical protein